MLADLSRVIGSTLDIDEVYACLAREIGKLVPFDRIAIDIVDIEHETLEHAYASGMGAEEDTVGSKEKLPGTLTEHVTNTRSGLIVQTESISLGMR